MVINVRQLPGTILVVTEISYQDAGTYTCEGRSTAPGASTQWASASIELQLNLIEINDQSTVEYTTQNVKSSSKRGLYYVTMAVYVCVCMYVISLFKKNINIY